MPDHDKPRHVSVAMHDEVKQETCLGRVHLNDTRWMIDVAQQLALILIRKSILFWGNCLL